MRLAVTQISRPRADQLRYLVRMLEFGAVDFDRRAPALRTAPRAVVSTARVLPVPVGPRNSGFPTGRPSEFNPGGTPGRGPPPPARLRSAPRFSAAVLPRTSLTPAPLVQIKLYLRCRHCRAPSCSLVQPDATG